MRNTSFRRRSGRRVLGSITEAGYGRPPGVPAAPPLVVPEGTEGSIVCRACGVTVMALVSGRPQGHAPGGYRTNVRKGLVACDGSGNTGA